MSCPYYWWDHDYACRKSGEAVNEDIYYKYCRNYDYDCCPIYKQERLSDSNCYLTTACIQAKGLEDDCTELTVLRRFRDSYVMALPQGAEVVQHYYRTAPEIVAAIQGQKDGAEVFTALYEQLVVPCVADIQAGELERAYRRYEAVTLALEECYLKES